MKAHTHPCQSPDCATPVECRGTLERNHDGAPAVICVAFHLSGPEGGVDPGFLCEACWEKEMAA